MLFPNKRRSYGTANHWLNGRGLTLGRYLNEFYPKYDWGIIKKFFYENPIQSGVILEDYQKTNEKKQDEVIHLLIQGKSKIVFIIGARGKGKSCSAGWIVDGLHRKNNNFPIYYVGEGIEKNFPEWVRYKDKIQSVPNDSFIILDEAAIRYAAREFFKAENIQLGKMLAIARHKNLSVVFITQHVQLVDVTISRLRDIILWKQSNDYSLQERGDKSNPQKRFWNKVRMNMAPRKRNECLLEYPAEKRFINFKHNPPDWWSEKISTAFKSFDFKGENKKPKDDSPLDKL